VYPEYVPVASNPCGEQWMQAYDACRLLCLNLYSIVRQPFRKEANIDYDLLYDIAYMQQRLADDIVELEIQHVDRIIQKIKDDKEPLETKATELDLWEKIKEVASSSRRTGCGFTALADMLAALGLKYDSDEALKVVGKVMHIKMKAELDCTIDLAIQRGPFKGWDPLKEFHSGGPGGYGPATEHDFKGDNVFYQMLCDEFPEQVKRMLIYGRRNVSWSTVAPTGTVSIVSLLDKYPNVSAGIEPQFAMFYYRNKKVNAGEAGVRVDFKDANGDSWMTSPVVMGGLKEWIDIQGLPAGFVGVDQLPKEVLQELFEKSPYFGSCSGDIKWEKRIEMQALVQKYTTNAISSTINLPSNTSKDVVNDIYFKAWKSGLKGVTIYRDGCRTGVLNTTNASEGASKFTYRDAIKRPKEIEARLDVVTVKGIKYAVVVGLLDEKPYEVFAFNLPSEIKEPCTGKTIKVKKGHYNFLCDEVTLKNIQEIAVKKEEQTLTRLVSGMLRHGAKPEWVIGQIDKCDLEIVSFGKAVSRVLSKFVEKKETGEKCPECGNKLVKQEGCVKCTGCSYSKC
jgi:ribonucleoside-diphosphate reductase alpha chain